MRGTEAMCDDINQRSVEKTTMIESSPDEVTPGSRAQLGDSRTLREPSSTEGLLSLVEVEKNRSAGNLSLSVDADVGQDGVEKGDYDRILAR